MVNLDLIHTSMVNIISYSNISPFDFIDFNSILDSTLNLIDHV